MAPALESVLGSDLTAEQEERCRAAAALEPNRPADCFLPSSREAPAPLSARRTRGLLRGQSGEALQRLRTRARQEQTTLHGAFMAAAARAGFSMYGPIPALRMGSNISLRARCQPPVSEQALGLYVKVLPVHRALLSPLPFWEEARQWKQGLDASDFRQDWRFQILNARRNPVAIRDFLQRLSADDERCGRFRPFHLANRGHCARSDTGPFQVRSHHVLTSQSAIGNQFQLFIHGFENQLFWSLSFVEPLNSRATAKQLADHMDAELAAALMS